MEEITLEDLREYRRLKQSIKTLEAEREAVYVESPAPKTNTAGRSSVRIPADPTATKARKAIQLSDRLEQQLAELRQKTDRIEQFTLQIEDVQIGAMIRAHYIRGLTWEETSLQLYGYPDRFYCHKRVRRYFEKREEEQKHDHEEADARPGAESIH